MANQEQVDLLRQSVEVWNAWRNQNLDKSIDFSGVGLINSDLQGANLSGANLNGANLRNTDLSDAILTNANFCGANLSYVDFGGANLSGANLRNTDLSHADFFNADLSHADLFNADLRYTDLRNTDLRNTDLKNADLRNACLNDATISDRTLIDPKWKLVHNLVNGGVEKKDLRGFDLSSANLQRAKLRQANLINADLSYANLSYANLSYANLSGADLQSTDLSGADLCGANLNDTNLSATLISKDTQIDPKWQLIYEISQESGIGRDLSGAVFSNVILRGVQLSNANLSGANLSGADLSGADLSNANLSNANLSGADLSGADLSGAVLYNANCLESKLQNATLTGSCITDWNINTKTKFDSVLCDYIYRSYDDEKQVFTNRLPVNSERVFKAGEFEQWIKIHSEARKTIDLTFTEGIDWQAFFQSLQRVRQKYPDSGVGLQAIEKKGSAFVVRLETSSDADQSAIESTKLKLYKTQLQLSKAQGELRVFRGDMSDVLKQLAGRPMTHNETTIHTHYIGVQNSGSGDIKDFTQNIGTNLVEIGNLIKLLRETAQSFPERHKDDALDELQIIETNLVDLERTDPKRLCRGIKRLMLVGAAVTTFAGSAATGAVDLSKQANDFTGNVLELAKKLGIELVQDKQQGE